jgi:hypothetical protein
VATSSTLALNDKWIDQMVETLEKGALEKGE